LGLSNAQLAMFAWVSITHAAQHHIGRSSAWSVPAPLVHFPQCFSGLLSQCPSRTALALTDQVRPHSSKSIRVKHLTQTTKRSQTSKLGKNHGRHGYACPHSMDINLQRKTGSKPMDAGIAIPGVNDSFIGKAPDLNTDKAGATPLRDTPRWLTWQPLYL
jgi:hypothetical protein